MRYGLFQLQAVLFFSATRLILAALFLLGTYALTLNLVLLIEQRQMWRLLLEMTNDKGRRKWGNFLQTGRRLSRFYQLGSRYLRLLADANRLYGPATLRFFLVAYPQNAHLLMCLLLQREGGGSGTGSGSKVGGRTGAFTFGTSILLAQQLFIMFAVHVFSARMAGSFHRAVKPLTALLTAESTAHANWANKVASFRSRLRLATYLQAMNVSNRYGLRYGSVGAVTYASFARSLVFYGKFLIYSFRLFS